MNDNMSKGQKGYAVFREIKENVFVQITEWTDQGYYTSGWLIHRLVNNSSPFLPLQHILQRLFSRFRACELELLWQSKAPTVILYDFK